MFMYSLIGAGQKNCRCCIKTQKVMGQMLAIPEVLPGLGRPSRAVILNLPIVMNHNVNICVFPMVSGKGSFDTPPRGVDPQVENYCPTCFGILLQDTLRRLFVLLSSQIRSEPSSY